MGDALIASSSTVRWVIVRLRNAGWVERPGISRAGNEQLRRLLVTGATAVMPIRRSRPGNKQATEWLVKLLARKPRKLVAVAPGRQNCPQV